MPAKPRPNPPAYLVRVDIGALTRNLRVRLDRDKFTCHDAAKWLVRPAHYAATRACQMEASGDRQSYGEADYPSPFSATADPELFASDEDPRAFLEKSEVIAVWELRQ